MMSHFWKFIKHSALLGIFAVVLSNCAPPPEYQTTPQGNKWKLVSFGSQQKKLNTAEVIYIDAVIMDKSRKDSIGVFVHKPFRPYEDDLWEIISNHYVGDKIEYISTTHDFLREQYHAEDTLVYILYFDRMRTAAQLNDLKFKELEMLDELIRSDSIQTGYTEYNGIYFRSLHKTDTTAVLLGREVVLAYRGHTISGKVFDDSQRMEGPLKFIMGNENQVIEGIEIALGKMHRKEKMRVIIPSWLAFGARGSAGGHVPPYTTVVYELEVVDVGK